MSSRRSSSTFLQKWSGGGAKVWEAAPPGLVVEARRQAAAKVLSTALTAPDDAIAGVVTALRACTASAPAAGRPLFAANRDLPTMFASPREELWQLCTTLREHRGDGHVASLTAAGLSGCEPHCLMAAETGVPPRMFLVNRGWTEADWEHAHARLADKGLLEQSGNLTDAGAEIRHWIEGTTDDLAYQAYETLGPSGVDALLADLVVLAQDVARAAIIRYPNAMGLPRLGDPPT